MTMRRAVAGVALAMVLGSGGPAAGYEVVEVKDGGTLTGVVKFAGDPPKLASIPVKKDPEACGDSKPSEALVLGPNKRVKHAVVWIEGVTRGKKIEAVTTLDNARCVFAPHVVAAVIGGKTTLSNSDPILHNTHGFLDRATVFNLALPTQNQVIDITRRLRKPGVVEIQCDAHPHMRAWMIVRDHPYVAVTDENGSFKVADIPPGTYRVVAWHESWKVIATDKDGRITYDKPVTMTREVTIPGKGEARIEFELK
jgi:plastocyanin